MSFSDLYPERRGGVINPSVMQRVVGILNKMINFDGLFDLKMMVHSFMFSLVA